MAVPERTADAGALATEYPVRGWSVRTLVDNVIVGTVHDLVATEQTPRYLDVTLAPAERHVLVPIGQARADRVARFVWLPGLAAYQLESIPSHVHGPLLRGAEIRLIQAYNAALAGALFRRGYRVHAEHRFSRRRSTDSSGFVPLTTHPELRLAAGEADPRLWPLLDARNEVVGSVGDLLVDLSVMQARYAIARLVNERGMQPDILVPVEFLSLDTQAERVRLPSLSGEQLATLPAFEGRLDPAGENQILESFMPDRAGDFYNHPRFDPDVFLRADGQVRD